MWTGFPHWKKILSYLKLGLQFLKTADLCVCSLQAVTNQLGVVIWRRAGNICSCLFRITSCHFLDHLLCIYNQTMVQESFCNIWHYWVLSRPGWLQSQRTNCPNSGNFCLFHFLGALGLQIVCPEQLQLYLQRKSDGKL